MPEYLAPGVYVEEISGGAKPIEAVGTSTACFIGFTEKAQQSKVIDGVKRSDPVLFKPIFLTSWEEYVDTFGSFVPEFHTPLSVYAFFQNGGKRCYVLSMREIPRASRNLIGKQNGKDESKAFLKVESKLAGETGGSLRAIIEPLIDPPSVPAAAQEPNISSWKFKLKIQEVVPSGTVPPTDGSLVSEEVEYELYELEQGNRKTVALRSIGTQSELIELTEINSRTNVAWSDHAEVTPTAGQTINIESAGSNVNIPSTRPHLRAKAKKTGKDFTPLTVSVLTSEGVSSGSSPAANGNQSLRAGEKPRFTLKVEKLHPVTNKWEAKERRQVSLVEATNPGDESGQKFLRVEYLNGQRPTLVDVLVLEPEADISELTLADMWPTAQTITLDVPPLGVANKDEFVPAEYNDYVGDPMNRTGIGGLEEIDDINFICMPDLMKSWYVKKDNDDEWGKKYVQSIQALAIAHCDRLKNRMVILDPPPDMNPQQIKNWRNDVARYDSSRAALYYPWVEVMDPATSRTTYMPPSGFVAGIWARNDINRGVHKAPANEVVQLAIGLQFEVGQGHQEILNPIGINCIRPLRGMGIRVWGARTLSQSDPEWKYVNVRRLFHMIEQSIQRSTMWAVFEPNDHRLWAKLRRDVRNFLMVLYSQGMLFGATPGQAFFVKCDEENNPKFTRDLGQVIVDIGVSPSKPAEFVIFRIRQWSPEDDQA